MGLLDMAIAGGIAGGAKGWLIKLKEDAITAREKNLQRFRAGESKKERTFQASEADRIFKRGILQRKTEADITAKKGETTYQRRRGEEQVTYEQRETDKDRRFAEEMKARVSLQTELVEIKNKADSEFIKKRNDIATMLEDKTDEETGKTVTAEDQASTLMINSLTEKKGQRLKAVELYVDIRNNTIETLTGGLGNPTPEQLEAASSLASFLTGIRAPGGKGGEGAKGGRPSLLKVLDFLNEIKTDKPEPDMPITPQEGVTGTKRPLFSGEEMGRWGRDFVERSEEMPGLLNKYKYGTQAY